MSKRSIAFVLTIMVIGLAIFAVALFYEDEQTDALNYSAEEST